MSQARSVKGTIFGITDCSDSPGNDMFRLDDLQRTCENDNMTEATHQPPWASRFWREAFIQCSNPECRQTYPLDAKLFACRYCGDLVAVEYSPETLPPTYFISLWRARRFSDDPLDQSGVWRFRELMPPLKRSDIVTLREGNTPLYRARYAADYAGVADLTLKHLGLNPTGSFKDYGMTVALSHAKALGAHIVICASTGNTSASVAAYAARAGIKAVVLIPQGHVAMGKLAQALEFGAITLQVKGASFDDVLRLVRQLAELPEIYLLNSLNPFRIEGQKAILIELLDQRRWEIPDHIVLPGGNLGNAAALGRALEELRHLGLISRYPRVTIVQAAGASPLYQTILSGSPTICPVSAPRTRATAIRIGHPVNWKRALRVIETTGGFCEVVDDTEIADAKAAIGRDGIGCEPASAATLAGIRKLRRQGKISPDESIVALLTGHPLKDVEYTVAYHTRTLTDELTGQLVVGRLVNSPREVDARLDAIRRVLYDEDS